MGDEEEGLRGEDSPFRKTGEEVVAAGEGWGSV